MKFNKSKLLNVTITVATLAFLGLGCSKTDSNNPAADTGNAVSNTHYSAPVKTEIPARYSNVKGVALFSITNELKEQLALLGDKSPLGLDQFFVLLNPKVPTEGILVKASKPIDLSHNSLANHQLSVSGKVITIDQPNCALINHFTDKYGFTLAGDDQNRIIYIEADSLDDPDNVPATTNSASTSTSNAPAAPAEAAPVEEAKTVELIDENHPLTSQETAPEELPNPTDIAPASSQVPSSASSVASEASKPADIPVRNKVHSLNVTPAPKAPKAAESHSIVPAQEPQRETAAAPAEISQDQPIPQDIAPTAQAISAPPVPQDVAPTSQPLE